MACIRLREPGQERADAGIQRNDAGLGLADAPLGRHGHGQVILSVVEGQAAVPVVSWQPLRHAQPAQQGVIRAMLRHGRCRHEAPLPGVLAAAESEFVVLAARQARTQFLVPSLDLGHRPAGISYPDTSDLVGRVFQAFRDGVDDLSLERLPVGLEFRVGFQPGNGLVVAPPGGVKPQSQCPALLPRRIDPDPP